MFVFSMVVIAYLLFVWGCLVALGFDLLRSYCWFGIAWVCCLRSAWLCLLYVAVVFSLVCDWLFAGSLRLVVLLLLGSLFVTVWVETCFRLVLICLFCCVVDTDDYLLFDLLCFACFFVFFLFGVNVCCLFCV